MRNIILALAALLSTSAMATTYEFNMYDGVDRGMASAFVQGTKQLQDGDVLVINIDSPGGSVYAGLEIIRQMHALNRAGVTTQCVVTGRAASMAFGILAECQIRQGYKFSQYLWHPMRVGGLPALTTDEVQYVWVSMLSLENMMINRLCEQLKLDKPTFLKYYRAEAFHFTEELNKLSPGFIEQLD